MAGHGDIPTSVQAIKTGAEDFLETGHHAKGRLKSLSAVRQYDDTREQDVRNVTLRALFSRLIRRERQVFALLARGKPHKQLAFALGTSEQTSKLHRHNVTQIFQVQVLAELAVMAERLGVLSAVQCEKNRA